MPKPNHNHNPFSPMPTKKEKCCEKCNTDQMLGEREKRLGVLRKNMCMGDVVYEFDIAPIPEECFALGEEPVLNEVMRTPSLDVEYEMALPEKCKHCKSLKAKGVFPQDYPHIFESPDISNFK